MGMFSIWHWVIVLTVALLLFGGSGRIPNLMSDIAKGIRKFKRGLTETDDDDDKRKTRDNGNPEAINYIDDLTADSDIGSDNHTLS